ncbi:hypothetical protein MSAR_09140 [Mycolicibacterium sarraceniae]|uniref:Uncharacterized protein n=1 Tax=Mycolicibacterium sarraceniae TaxID=1534348 RepID=A0A7I7SLY3_9MYCO|nr:hypothetical protein MSAR_09140 [Mycolicibacterium sarraceniae]
MIDPLTLEPLAPAERRLIVGAWHDGGHVGHLFSGAVQAQIERFLGVLTQAP